MSINYTQCDNAQGHSIGGGFPSRNLFRYFSAQAHHLDQIINWVRQTQITITIANHSTSTNQSRLLLMANSFSNVQSSDLVHAMTTPTEKANHARTKITPICNHGCIEPEGYVRRTASASFMDAASNSSTRFMVLPSRGGTGYTSKMGRGKGGLTARTALTHSNVFAKKSVKLRVECFGPIKSFPLTRRKELSLLFRVRLKVK